MDSDIKKEISGHISGVVADQVALRKQLNIEIVERKGEAKKIENLSRNNTTRVDGVEKFTVAGLELLKQQIDVLNTSIKNLKSSKSLGSATQALRAKEVRMEHDTFQDMENLHRLVDDLKTTVNHLKNQTDGNSIKFGGLGFTSGYDAGAWTEANVGNNGYGWIYDYHILMQAVWSNISGEDLVKRLTKGYKLDIENGHQLATIGSFETDLPRFFSKTHGHTVTHRDQSFFGSIKTWAEWDLPHQGFRDRLNREIEYVRNDHEKNIRDNLKSGSSLYTLAIEALHTSYTWSVSILKFGDDIYKIYTRAKFGSAVAWHVTTRLMRVLILEIAEPRHGVALSLKAANQNKIAKVTLLASLRSLDIMREIQRLNFENHPAVANELVKFLAVNTEFDSIKNLQTDVAQIQKDVTHALREISNILKTQQTIANKTDQLKNDAAALVKRVKALEK